ncbi:MAG: hypothetical protein KGO96_10670 [Elusimicrobia bacterium]|nr:hypothetical protein [Elusimicrobiota bacterium]
MRVFRIRPHEQFHLDLSEGTILVMDTDEELLDILIALRLAGHDGHVLLKRALVGSSAAEERPRRE